MLTPPDRITAYLELVRTRPDAFDNPDPAGIVILTDPAEIIEAEDIIKQRGRAKGHPENWAECGIYYEDPWMILVRDIVRFPDGNPGTYHHILLRHGQDGVVIFPVVGEKVVLLRHFRNGARSWSWEIPRGGPSRHDPLENALGELAEEIGATPLSIEKLGATRNNNGMISEVMHIYFARLDAIGNANLAEGIDQVQLVTVSELEDMIVSGEIDDCHTVHAFALARLGKML